MKFLEFFKSVQNDFDGIIFDVDGTLVAGRNRLPGAGELIDYLRSNQIAFTLLTNDGNHSIKEKCRLINRCNLDITEPEIISCSMALQPLAKERNLIDAKVFVMGDLGDPCFAYLAKMHPTRDLSQIDQCAAVVVGEGKYDWHDHIQGVFNFFRRHPDRPMIVPNPDRYWPSGENNEFGIGAGGKARFIDTLLKEMDIKIEIIYLGKPYRAIYELAARIMLPQQKVENINFQRLLMVGDSLKSDICGANRLGMKSALLLTGITTKLQAENAVGELKPDWIFEVIA